MKQSVLRIILLMVVLLLTAIWFRDRQETDRHEVGLGSERKVSQGRSGLSSESGKISSRDGREAEQEKPGFVATALAETPDNAGMIVVPAFQTGGDMGGLYAIRNRKGELIRRGTSESPVFSIEISPNEERIWVNAGGGKSYVINERGEKLQDLPHVPPGKHLLRFSKLLHEGMQVNATKAKADDAVGVAGLSRIKFYTKDGVRISDPDKDLHVPDLANPPADRYLSRLVTDGEITLFIEGANEFGNLPVNQCDRLGGARLRLRYTGQAGATENKLLVYRGGFLTFRMPKTAAPLPANGVLGSLQFWDGKGRVRHQFGGKDKEFKQDVTDWGTCLNSWEARSGRENGADYNERDKGGHVPPGWYRQWISDKDWVNASDDNHQINRWEKDASMNPAERFLDQGSYCRWTNDDLIGSGGYSKSFRYHPQK